MIRDSTFHFLGLSVHPCKINKGRRSTKMIIFYYFIMQSNQLHMNWKMYEWKKVTVQILNLTKMMKIITVKYVYIPVSLALCLCLSLSLSLSLSLPIQNSTLYLLKCWRSCSLGHKIALAWPFTSLLVLGTHILAIKRPNYMCCTAFLVFRFFLDAGLLY